MWQALHTELESKGLTIVTVALDVNLEDAKPWIELARPADNQTDVPGATERMHPALIDSEHVVDMLFGITNVPMAVWIDETGQLVRPAEKASIEPSVRWWREAHRLDPSNWTYKRQAWTFVTTTPGERRTCCKLRTMFRRAAGLATSWHRAAAKRITTHQPSESLKTEEATGNLIGPGGFFPALVV